MPRLRQAPSCAEWLGHRLRLLLPGTAAYKKRMAAITQPPRSKSQEKRIRAQKGLPSLPEVRYRLIQDESCHWYVIRTDQEDEFNAWQDAMAGCEKWNGHDFSNDAIGGSPGLVTFPSFEIG